MGIESFIHGNRHTMFLSVTMRQFFQQRNIRSIAGFLPKPSGTLTLPPCSGAIMRPRPVSQLQKPKHSRNITAALSIGSLVKMKQNFATTQKEDLKTRLHATRVQPWQQSKARPIVAATVTGSAAMVVALGIFLRTTN